MAVFLIGYNKSDNPDPWVGSINEMRTHSQRTGVLSHTVLNTQCNATVTHEVLIEISEYDYINLVESINEMRTYSQRMSILSNTVLNTQCIATVVHEVLIEISEYDFVDLVGSIMK